jgi:hypothetical protein
MIFMSESIELDDLHVKLPKELKMEIKIFCVENGCTMKDLTLNLYQDYFKSIEK